ncbi:mucin-5AC-like [Teleopsis dalmanni]|uniref:mucin-5AC-like n=1 Tax=Teleopsis dalmanni TaxID=139649 RepID=UPI0018CD82B0|nr:mucin-5AC-like [Teleopsis dalmanni]
MKPFDKYQDIEQGGYAKFTGLKTYNKQLKTMIAIGGWNEASSRFSPLVANPERRQKFIKNILKFLRQNHFDGIDLDWEYPAHREGGKPRDRDNYAQFVQELRAEFEREAEKTGRPRLLLTMAVPAGIEYIDKGYDIPKLNKYLDWFNVLTYDFHSSHEPSVNHHAPLYSLEEESEYNYDSELNIDYSIKYYLKAGADRDKLVLGIPTYGRSYTLINEESTELGAPSEGPGEQGDATREKGYLAYYEICQNLKEDPEWTVVQPNPTAMGPYAYRRNQWVGYDDEDIVRKKAEYVVEQGLGGIMFWAIDNDDFRGSCTGKPYPLIEAAKEAMVEGLGLGVNEVSKPSSAKKPLRSRSRDNTSSTRNRIDGTSDDKLSVDQRKTTSRRPTSGPRKRVQSSTTNAPSTTIKLTEAEGSSLYIGGRTSTPPPPTTPDPGTDFKCEEEGFFQHPRDCKKYYWCLDSGPSGLGIVAHMFTCPSGLYFNPAADSCDFARNVPCKIKKGTTASPVTTTTSTSTTTPRTTTASNRITAATSRTSLFRTTTTSTTAAPEEEEEYEYEEEEIPTKDSKDKNAEEDPRVIKELIELIRKVGGIDELEKHLLHKEDGTISLKDNDTNSGTPTTQSSISKSLYDKVLSRPNAYNSFRNRLTTSTLFRNSAQIKTEEVEKKEGSTKFEEDILQQKSSSKVGNSKYSSVVRGNSRQGPQNEGLENLPEFDGFLKEKKEYVTINRQRGSYKAQYSKDEDNEEDENEKEDQDEGVEIENIRTTKKPSAITTPAYVSIRRSRPTTTLQPVIQNINNEEDKDELKTVEEVTEKKSYTSLNRYRGRPTTTTEKIESNDEVESTTTRYKYFERTRPTRITTTRTTGEKSDVDDKDDDNDDNDEEENKQNVTVQNKEENDSTQNTQTTTRIYASIGRRPITTTTSEPSITTTTEIPIAKTNLLETTYTPEPISTTTTTHSPNTITNIPDIISNSFTPISSTTSTTTTTTSTTTTTTSTTPNSDPLLETTSISSTEINPYNMSDDTFALSLDINSLKQTDADSASNSIKNEADAVDGNQETSTTTTQTTTKTLTTTGTTNIDHQQSIDEVTNLNKNISKTQYKYTTRTRNVTSFTTATNDKNTDTKISNENTQPSLIDIRSNIGLSSNSNKYVGGRRQQLNNLLNRKSQIQIQQTNETSITNTTSEPTSTNVFVGAVSSPRPFGFPRRRNRPSSFTTKIEDSKPVSENDEDAVLIKSKIYAQNANANTNKQRAPTASLSSTAVSRRPAFSVRRRIINTTATGSNSATTTTGITTTNNNNNNELTTTTLTELQTTSKYNRNRSRLPATTTPAVSSSSSSLLATTIFGFNNNNKNYLNSKFKKTKLATSSNDLNTASSLSSSTASSAIATSANDITQRPYIATKYTSPALRLKYQSRRLLPTTTTAINLEESVTDAPRTQNPLFKRRLSHTLTAHAPATTTIQTTTLTSSVFPSTANPIEALTTTIFLDGIDDATDQIAKSSIHTSLFNHITGQAEEDDEDGNVSAIKSIPVAAPLTRHVTTPPETNFNYEKETRRRMDVSPKVSITTTPTTTAAPTTKPSINRRPQKTTPTQTTTANTRKVNTFINRRQPHKYSEPIDQFNIKPGKSVTKTTSKPPPAPPKQTYRPTEDYDYYDEDDEPVIGSTKGQDLKVILHGKGIIECLDQGNFPHPLSCRKFISCAKFETGGVVGWEYTCPKGLSYDPVGGMCNWAAGLGCKE